MIILHLKPDEIRTALRGHLTRILELMEPVDPQKIRLAAILYTGDGDFENAPILRVEIDV